MVATREQIPAQAAPPPAGASATGPDPLPPDLVIGRTVAGNFRVTKLIGSGGMGNVYQAEQLSLGKMVAIKVLHRELMMDERLIRRFELEAKNASSLNHPNSIQIIDFGRDGDLVYIAMELLPGKDLLQLIAELGAVPVERAVRIMAQVLAALDEAHAANIVHRDLKPSNIMLVPRRGQADLVKVCDFGIAKCRTGAEQGQGQAMLTMKGLVCGTPEYMSPEQARGEEVDGRSDLYSATVILYQMLTGELLFAAPSPVAILSKHLVERPEPPSVRKPGLDLPPGLEALVLQGLAKDPTQRPQSAAEFRAALLAAFPVDPSASVSDGLPRSTGSVPQRQSVGDGTAKTMLAPSEPKKRRPVLPRVILGVAVAGAAIAAAAFLGRGDTDRSESTPVITVRDSPARLPSPAVPAPAPAAADPATAPIGASVEPTAPTAQPESEAEPNAQPEPPAAIVKAAIAKRPRKVAARSDKIPATGATTEIAAPPAPTTTPSAAPSSPPAATAPQPGLAIMADAKRLASQGEVGAACARAEEARRQAPKDATIYKFLGQCYNRIGDVEKARTNNAKYLELFPNAPDAPFIRNQLKQM